MPLDDEDKELLDNADPEQVRQAIVEELRENDGAQLRALLKARRDSTAPEAKGFYARLVRNQALHDLVSH